VATPDEPSHQLAPGRLGAAAVTFFALAATAPIATVVNVVPAAYVRGGRLVPFIFVALGLVLVLFSAGYAAMARRLPFAGAMYAYVTRGLGRPAGVAAAWVAVLSYNAIQLGLYGLVGAAVDGWSGLSLPWWQVAVGCWLVVALGGTIRVEIIGGLLALAVLAEVAVVVGYSAANLIGDPIVPAGPTDTDRPTLGLLLAVGMLAFVGFETTGAYAEESIRPRRQTGQAGYAAVIVLALLPAVASWSVGVAAGPDQAGARGAQLVFDLAAARLAPWTVTVGRLVLVTGLVAALLAVHQTIARYLFALGRERVLPARLGRTARRTMAPRAASLTQSAIAALVVTVGYLLRLDSPAVFAAAGGLGILLVLLATSVAALLHLNRMPEHAGLYRGLVAPMLSTVALGVLAYSAFGNLPALLGVPAGSPLVLIVPAVLAGAVALGLAHALLLRATRPIDYAGIGEQGTPVVTARALPEPRDPGRHRPERVRP
jgi:amino acid transporter